MVQVFFALFVNQNLLSKLCGLDLPTWNGGQRHYQNKHGVTADEASHIASSPGELGEWRRVNGFTDIPGQCGYCLKVFRGNCVSMVLTKHRKVCAASVGFNAGGSKSNPTSALEEIINDSGPALNTPVETQEIVELRTQIQKLIRRVEQLKDSKANKLLAKSKSREVKLERKVKMLKTEKRQLLEKYVKVLETLLKEK